MSSQSSQSSDWSNGYLHGGKRYDFVAMIVDWLKAKSVVKCESYIAEPDQVIALDNEQCYFRLLFGLCSNLIKRGRNRLIWEGCRSISRSVSRQYVHFGTGGGSIHFVLCVPFSNEWTGTVNGWMDAWLVDWLTDWPECRCSPRWPGDTRTWTHSFTHSQPTDD